MSEVLLRVVEVGKSFATGTFSKKITVLFQDISFELNAGETLGIMGPSGAGKTTLGKIITGMISPSSGGVEYNRHNISQLRKKEYRKYRRAIQMIFQDPEGSFNPVKTIRRSLSDVLAFIKYPQQNREEKMVQCLGEVSLEPDILNRYPHQLSGGMNQRAALARVLLLEPELIVLDEPTSALDATVQIQILHLLKQLKKNKNLSYLLISHNKHVIKWMSDRVGILTNGKLIIEERDI